MMTQLERCVALAGVAVVAVTLAAGSAHARGGLKAQTVELLPVAGLDTGAESLSGNPNANASAVTAFNFILTGAKSTVWTAIAEDLLANTEYGLFNLRSGAPIEDCSLGDFIGAFTTDASGNLPEPTTIGTETERVENVVYVCRDPLGLDDGPLLILSGELKSGGQSGGKNPNK